ncbi:hypothetical protein DRH29_03500 [candidate division Kazan bacterium]|uniref:Heavy-metal chelation domain-containing protein n=1 Tax=candidate division Kazan bacterium TaxID=2202143 RepID=A0A420ZCD1_UNCK3|nr:MAG: hypothetical protein DRH29_03500 [candidate division Kazan bacterium]
MSALQVNVHSRKQTGEIPSLRRGRFVEPQRKFAVYNNMGIADRITETLADSAVELNVSDVRIGVKYVSVQLDNGSIGLAYLFPESLRCENMLLSDDSHLAGMNAGELLSWLKTNNSLSRSIGLAAANAVIGSPGGRTLSGDVRSVIGLQAGEQVAMIGHFEPLVKDIRDQCSLKIYEIDTTMADGLIESSDATEGLGSCDVALMTGTAIINGTMDGLLEAATDCREVVILGPSTPLVPEAFSGTPVTVLSGVVVIDDKILRVVSEGGGMRRFKPCVQKLNLRLN